MVEVAHAIEHESRVIKHQLDFWKSTSIDVCMHLAMCSFPPNYSLHDSSHSRQSLASLDNIVVVSVCFPHQECSCPPPQLESSLSCNSSPHSPLRRELVPPAVSVLIRGIKIMANWTPKSQYQDFMPLMCMWKFERNSYFAKCPVWQKYTNLLFV